MKSLASPALNVQVAPFYRQRLRSPVMALPQMNDPIGPLLGLHGPCSRKCGMARLMQWELLDLWKSRYPVNRGFLKRLPRLPRLGRLAKSLRLKNPGLVVVTNGVRDT